MPLHQVVAYVTVVAVVDLVLPTDKVAEAVLLILSSPLLERLAAAVGEVMAAGITTQVILRWAITAHHMALVVAEFLMLLMFLTVVAVALMVMGYSHIRLLM
jgi:hypothetical protein